MPQATQTARDVVREEMELAVELRAEKEELFKRIARNRRVLRDLGTLTAQEREWVNKFYPKKQKGEPDPEQNGDDAKK